MNKATLRLFNAIQVENKTQGYGNAHLKRCISNGYILNHAIDPKESTLKEIESIVGISGEKANASFHKSWKIVRDSDMEVLVVQQIMHYFTTYGFEALGIYNKNTVYVPVEVLKIPKIKKGISLIVVKAMTSQEILDAILVLGAGIALASTTLNDIMAIVETNKYDSVFVEKINNRELKTRLYEFYDIVPAKPVEYLRYVIQQITNESLLIKNDYLISMIKASEGKFLDHLIKKAPKDLASIFFRYKPLFLAMKSISKNKHFFNRLRKDANKMHKALPTDYLNGVTSQIKNKELNLKVLRKHLKNASIFRKIRLAYALNNRINSCNSIVYKVRNGRGWVTDFEWDNELNNRTQKALKNVLLSISDSIQKNVSGKTFYIPENIHYVLPATEKQFIGNLPSNTYATVPNDMIIGVHWTNTNRRIDLDFSMIQQSGKFGWDAGYRQGKDVLFSGDLVNAPKPNGASELFYMSEAQEEANILMLNYFNFSADDKVTFKFFVANEKTKKLDKNYMVSPNNIILSCNVETDQKQMILGLVISVNGENRLYFSNTSIGNSITSRTNEVSTKARNFMVASCVGAINLETILTMAGANIVSKKPEEEYVDLSPEALDKTTIIDLLQGE